jgi:hypothetical protein
VEACRERKGQDGEQDTGVTNRKREGKRVKRGKGKGSLKREKEAYGRYQLFTIYVQ